LSTPLRFAIACIYLFLFVVLSWVILAYDNYNFPSPPSFHIPFIGRPSEWARHHGVDTTWVGLIVLVLTWVGVVKIAARNYFGNSRPSFALTSPAATSQTNNAQVLFFKSSESAFEAACKYGGCDLKEGAVLVAIVLDTRKIIGGDVAVKTLDDGRQRVSLMVSAADGGFSVIADTLSPYGPKLEPGNLVSWRIGGYSKEAAEVCGDQRSGWVGLVTAKLKPEYSVKDGWKVDSVFGAATINSPTPARAIELAQNKERKERLLKGAKSILERKASNSQANPKQKSERQKEPKPMVDTNKQHWVCPHCSAPTPLRVSKCPTCKTNYLGTYQPRFIPGSEAE
jgi:rubrerythrin